MNPSSLSTLISLDANRLRSISTPAAPHNDTTKFHTGLTPEEKDLLLRKAQDAHRQEQAVAALCDMRRRIQSMEQDSSHM